MRLFEAGVSNPQEGFTILGGEVVVTQASEDLRILRTAIFQAGLLDSGMPVEESLRLALRRGIRDQSPEIGDLPDVRLRVPEVGGADEIIRRYLYLARGDFVEEREALSTGLALAEQFVQEGEARGEYCTIAVSIANGVGKGREPLEVRVDEPAFAVHGGSLGASLFTGSFKAAQWVVIVMLGRGPSRIRASEELAEELRNRMVRGGHSAAPRIERGNPGAYSGKRAVLVLLHGLLGTDVGTFDGLTRELKRHADLAAEVEVVAWPHDTLRGIQDNALQLANVLQRVVGLGGLPILFACHSRGGLVARATVTRLVDVNRKWQRQIRGCITFGTPHEGTGLAEAPGTLVGVFVLSTVFHSRVGVASMLDVLRVLENPNEVPGIRDLQPIGGANRFLVDLVGTEMQQAGGVGNRAMPILAIGGSLPPAGLLGALAERLHRGRVNDLVVELSSSAPEHFSDRLEVTSDHFGYATQANLGEPARMAILNFLRARV